MNGPITSEEDAATDCEIRKIGAEYDRKDAEARRVHHRELITLRVSKRLEREAAQEAAAENLRAERIKSSGALEDELNKLYHQKVADVSVAGIDRARDGAKFVQTAATAVFAVYTGLLALVYSVTTNPLPLRGAWAGVFFGLAIAFATAYLAFLVESAKQNPSLDNRSLVQRQYSRTARLTEWVRASVNSGRYSSRAAVLSLAFGAFFMAAPFVSGVAATSAVEPPIPPAPPGTVAAGFEDQALELFRAQVDDYKIALEAHKTNLQVRESAAGARAAAEEELNRQFVWAGGLAMAVVLLGPALYGLIERHRITRSSEPGAHGQPQVKSPRGLLKFLTRRPTSEGDAAMIYVDPRADGSDTDD